MYFYKIIFIECLNLEIHHHLVTKLNNLPKYLNIDMQIDKPYIKQTI